jgi:two-component system, cell cycle sensor histidine kinase and response regulator CckA
MTRTSRQFLIATIASMAGVAAAGYAPLASDAPGMFILGLTIVLGLTLNARPALLGIAIAAVGLALIRPASSIAGELIRAAILFVLAGSVVAIAHGRRRSDEATALYRVAFEQNPLPMWMYDDDTLEFLAVNAAASDKYGYRREEFDRMTLRDMRPEEDLAALALRPAKGLPHYTGTWRHRTKSGQLLQVLVRSSLVHNNGRRARLALLEDLTERTTLEAQLRQAQKMDTVGRLAGGIAHDFNNVLTAVFSYCELVLDDLPAGDRRRADIEEIKKAATSAASLTRGLLAFSRKQIIEPKVVDLNAVVSDMANILQRVIGEDVEMALRLDPQLGRVKVDSGQMGQLLMNLVVNARDAMPSGGKLTIETNNVILDEAYAGCHLSVVPGAHVMLAVTDTGTGMPPEVQARLFEPFFTTKEPGKGTGLGLASVYGIVKQSGGNIWVYSEVGHGTTFKVYLPSVEAPLSRVAPVVPLERPSEAATILVVEDNPSLAQIARRVLERHGYTVISAASPDEALEKSRTHTGPIQLLLSDVVMPGRSGPVLAGQLTAERPDMRVIHMSGYTDDALIRHGTLVGTTAFLPKPFTPDGLLRKVSEVLAASAPTTA